MRQAVQELNGFFADFGFTQYPDKTFIGRIDKGFIWLVYQFSRTGVMGVSPRTLANHERVLHPLYEQARRRHLMQEETEQRVALYKIR